MITHATANEHYCHMCGYWAILLDNVYCRYCLSVFYGTELEK